mmetsp:Transcript_14618/g.21377  ORF Transcript_14618/g.21377 Transcript_14618/m.21377 type:complete len:145 (+) Transcript_14618:620-1054(+)
MSVLGFEYSKFRSVARYLISGSLYVVTGVVQIICMQALMYEGGGGGKHTDFFVAREYRLTSCANLRFRTECCSDRDTFLISIPNYLGNVLVFFAGEPILRLFRNASVDNKEGTQKSVWKSTAEVCCPLFERFSLASVCPVSTAA